MLIVCRTKAPRRELTVIGSQYQRVRRVEMPVKMGCSRRSASPWLVLPGMRSAVETESAVKKCSLAVIGEVSALASRNQVYIQHFNAIAAPVGEKIGAARPGGSENLHQTGQRRAGAGAHVQWLGGQPGSRRYGSRQQVPKQRPTTLRIEHRPFNGHRAFGTRQCKAYTLGFPMLTRSWCGGACHWHRNKRWGITDRRRPLNLTDPLMDQISGQAILQPHAGYRGVRLLTRFDDPGLELGRKTAALSTGQIPRSPQQRQMLFSEDGCTDRQKPNAPRQRRGDGRHSLAKPTSSRRWACCWSAYRDVGLSCMTVPRYHLESRRRLPKPY